MSKKIKKENSTTIHIHYTDIASDPAYNSEIELPYEPTLEETLDWIYEEDEKIIPSENKPDEDN